MSLTTTTQNPLTAHARYPIIVTMPVTADKRYSYAAIEPGNPGLVSNEQSSHHALEYLVGQVLVAVIGLF
ncbi:hypothetical protein LC653_15105 [Nostoc sp. CHAB 5784]|nr:hypothetical protein [Nostoc mirabile]MCC5665208.1 hypothetical protein [Nostoc mirabile CHAB5784]